MRLWPRKRKPLTVYVPSDFEFLDPDRPDVVYEKDMTPEERERFAERIAAVKARAAKSSIQPPYKVHLPDGTEIPVEPAKKTMQQIAFEVSAEWDRAGRPSLAVPPDNPGRAEDEIAFWDEVERRFEAQSD